MLQFTLNLISVFILINVIYKKANIKTEYNFTFYMFNIAIFFICFLLNKVELSLGAAFGLFAVFGMLRYRAEDLSIKDMTYIFLVIALGLINSISSFIEYGVFFNFILFFAINACVLLFCNIFESNLIYKNQLSQHLIIDVKYLNKTNSELYCYILEITGLTIVHHRIIKTDLINDSVLIKVYYES
ncbi:MAG: DUF4956 domain-containing protein [Bacteroidetes bacterium]|nr:DUF4956 domain-containing protein [Bacteroidota bacterium]